MEGQFVKVGLGFPGILLGSRAFSALRWTMPGMALGDVASRRWLYLAAKLSHVGVDVDSLACPPAPSYGLRSSDEGSELPARCGLVLSCCSGRWHHSGGCKAPRLGYSVEC
jgi:hypothetical protein